MGLGLGGSSLVDLARNISEGESIGNVTLAIDMTQARQQAQDISDQFDALIDQNSQLLQTTFLTTSTGHPTE